MSWLPHDVIAAPVVEPLTLAQAKDQVGIDADNDAFDDLLNGCIAAARSHAEQVTGTKFITQTVLLRARCFSTLCRFPIGPLIAVQSINYLDPEGIEQLLAPSVYETVAAGRRSMVRLKVGQSWPGVRSVPDAVRVTATFGFGGSASDVPADIIHALRLMIADWFRNREDSTTAKLTSIPTGATVLLRNHWS